MSSAVSVQGSASDLGTRRLFRPRNVVLAVAMLVVAVAATLSLIDQDQAQVIGPLGMMCGLGAAGVLMLSGGSVYRDRERLAWRLLGGGVVTSAIGILVVGLIQTIRGSITAFGPPDLIFLAAYALVLSGFVLMPQLGTQLRSRVRVMLDGTIGALSVVTILWVFYYDTLAALLASATFWERFAGLAYPVADSLLVVAALIVTIRRSIWRFDLRVVFFGIGMVVQAIADLTLLSTGVGQTFEEAKPNFFLFLVAVMFYLSTAAVIRKSPRVYEFADRGQPLWSLLAPYAPSLIVVAIIVVRLPLSQLDGELQLLLLGGLLLGALVVTRQAVALREYRSAVDQQRSALVASVSHELRTPLTAMVGFLNVMNTQPEDLDEAEKAELTDVVYQQALYMSRIVADLLLLARDSSALQLKEADVSVNDLILDRIRTLTNPDATIETEIEPNLVAHVDSDRLRQVLANLLVNGRRYGRGKVLLRAVSVDHDLMIEVHDNGNGVPRKYELAIWNQFERGAHRLNSAVPGSGIGLAVVNRIVRRHGGTASYERSKRLGGSCFRIVLPGRMRRPATSEEYVVAGQVAAT